MLLTEETRADPRAAVRKGKAILMAVIIHLILIGLFLVIAVFPPLRDEPEIVAQVVAAPKSAQPKMEKKVVMKQIDQASTPSAASPIAKMLRANTAAKIAAPEVTKVNEGPLGLGEGDFGSGFGSGSGGGSGMGAGATLFGSRSGGPLVGRLFDMKQDRERNPKPYDPGVGAFFGRVMKVVDGKFSDSSLKEYYEAKAKLGFTFLAIPNMSADEGPKAFQAEKEIEPRGWFVVYSGVVRPPVSGNWRFLGSFDDCLMVMVNGRMVLDASWDDATRDASIREVTTLPRFLPSKPIYAGKWVNLPSSAKIDVIVGERPGGFLGGTLLVEKKGGKYKERDDGSPILPIFSTMALDAKARERLKDSGYLFAAETPVFKSGSK